MTPHHDDDDRRRRPGSAVASRNLGAAHRSLSDVWAASDRPCGRSLAGPSARSTRPVAELPLTESARVDELERGERVSHLTDYRDYNGPSTNAPGLSTDSSAATLRRHAMADHRLSASVALVVLGLASAMPAQVTASRTASPRTPSGHRRVPASSPASSLTSGSSPLSTPPCKCFPSSPPRARRTCARRRRR